MFIATGILSLDENVPVLNAKERPCWKVGCELKSGNLCLARVKPKWPLIGKKLSQNSIRVFRRLWTMTKLQPSNSQRNRKCSVSLPRALQLAGSESTGGFTVPSCGHLTIWSKLLPGQALQNEKASVWGKEPGRPSLAGAPLTGQFVCVHTLGTGWGRAEWDKGN